ncbi:TPA: hypothetical protein P5R10_001840 [Legionella pneumophila]|nr:hypothetical protein [Legionella pneumophila]HAT8828974.1 hypothetical protein [Legionella pneumophila subsp. pneumophila]HAT9531317.1 hypothetical protein [Legionella pneumophila subsp. pneumophila]HAU0767055.1 hypothetical protein [Legionella pneumophila]HAU0991077.1 hypothetical protein [Legionella pneumophila]
MGVYYMEPLEKDITYFVVGKKIVTSESSSFLDTEHPYPKKRKKISAEEIKGAVPTSEAILFRTRKEAERYVRLTAKDIGSSVKEHSKEAPIFEVQLRNSIHEPQIVTENIERELGKSVSVQYTKVNPENLRYLSGGVPEIQGKYDFKPTDEVNVKTPKEWLDKIGFESKIEALQKKLGRLQKDDPNAGDELENILKELRANKKEFVEGRKNAKQFVDACTDAIKPDNTKALAGHRGLFASIKSFVESIVQLVNPKFKINSDSINKIKDVEKSLGEIKPEQVVHETDIAKRTLKSEYEVDSENKVAKTGQGGPSTKPG